MMRSPASWRDCSTESTTMTSALATRADDGGDASFFAGQIFGSHARGRARAQLAHVIGFDQSEQVTRGHFVERNKEAKLATDVSVLLHGDEAARVIGRGHVMEKASAWQF